MGFDSPLGNWKVVRFLIALIGWFLCGLYFWTQGGSFLLCQEANIPPDILSVNDLHCQISPQGKKWTATCVASYQNHENYHHEPWTVKFPPRKNEPIANKDAIQWIERVNKIRAVTRPVTLEELKKEKQ